MIFAAILLIGLLWMALLYLGILLGIIGWCVAFYMFKANPADWSRYPTDRAHSQAIKTRQNAVFLAAASAVLFAASLAGNYFSKDAPLHGFLNGGKEPLPAEQGED